MITSIHLDHVKFCAEECERQAVGPIKVYNMMQAYWYALNQSQYAMPDKTAILVMARYIEPELNANGYRNTPVIIRAGVGAGLVQPVSHTLVPRAMDNLSEAIYSNYLPAYIYKEFETIHPFIDGNGRVGAILYNWLNATLVAPITPPGFN